MSMNPEGWGNPRPFNPAAKFHYFVGDTSLCKKWGNALQRIPLVTRRDDYTGNCNRCKAERAVRERGNKERV